MKAPLKLFLFMFLPVLSASADTAYVCKMGDYDFKGVYYSDSYKRPETKGQPSCSQRDMMDSEKIKNEYNDNHQKIQKQIAKILNDPQCVSLKPFIDEYLEKLKKNEANFAELTNIRTEYVADKIKQYDVQKAYAYAGAFNGTCSGGHNRKTSFINLELINKLPQAKGDATQVVKEGDKIESCSDVKAAGSDTDLKSFFVSTKKAKGSDFILTWDPYGVPDHIVVKSKSGEMIYDSGCKGADTSPAPMKLPLPKEGMVINIINTCETPNEKGSAWDLRIQCSEPSPPELCKDPREELIRLLKEEVNQTKILIDANQLQRECYYYIDKDILGKLLSDGMIEEDSAPMTNGLCDVMDEGCAGRSSESSNKDQSGSGSAKSNSTKSLAPSLANSGFILPYREPSQEQFHCPPRKEVEHSLFKTVSYAYCTQGWKRLGLEDAVPE
jgi:hypothetical protein